MTISLNNKKKKKKRKLEDQKNQSDNLLLIYLFKDFYQEYAENKKKAQM